MKSIKHIVLGALVTISALGTVVYTSCNKDKCKDVVCQNGGTCSDGNCTCTAGYEGTNCETPSRDKFTAKTWTATDKSVATGTTMPAYVATITAGTTITDVLIGTFSGTTSAGTSYFVNSVKATVGQDGITITIPSQAPDNDGYTVSGTGTYNEASKQISWSYTLGDPSGATLSYTGTWQ